MILVIMIDTVRITKQGSIEGKTFKRKDPDTWSINTVAGEYVSAKKIIKLNETERGDYNGTVGVTYDNLRGFINVQVSSIPVMVLGSSLKEISVNDLAMVEGGITDIISSCMDIDPEGFVYTRLDNSTILQMEREAGNYIACLDGITRAKEGHYKKKYYDMQTVELFNNTRVIGFYDKIAKNKLNRVEARLIELNKDRNKLRFEIQNKTQASIRAMNGGEIILLGQLSKPEVVENILRQRVDLFDSFFQFKAINGVGGFGDYMQILLNMKQDYKRNSMLYFMAYMAMDKGNTGLKEVEQYMKLAGYGRSYVHDFLKRLKGVQFYVRGQAEIYQEVSRKVHEKSDIKKVA